MGRNPTPAATGVGSNYTKPLIDSSSRTCTHRGLARGTCLMHITYHDTLNEITFAYGVNSRQLSLYKPDITAMPGVSRDTAGGCFHLVAALDVR